MAQEVKKDISDLVVSTDVMAKLLGFTRRRINQLVNEGVLERKAPGRFLLLQNIQKYIEFLRTGQYEEDEEAQAEYWEEKALHERAKREMAELKLAKLKSQLHDAKDIELVMTNMLVNFRNRILGIPQKVAPKIIGMENLAEINNVLSVELHEALTELSEYDPSMFVGGEIDEKEDDQADSEDIEGSSTTAENDGQSVGG